MTPKTIFKLLYIFVGVAALYIAVMRISTGTYTNAAFALLVFIFCAYRFYLTDKGRR